MPSRRRPPAAIGKPSFAYFPADYVPHDVWRPDKLLGLSFPECAISRHSRYLTTIRTKHTSMRHILAARTMITGPDRSRRHMIASAMSRRSLRAAGGLLRPSESRAFLASRSTIYLDDACRFEPRPLDLREGDLHGARTYGRSEDICTNLRKPKIG